ncbi:MAG: hypothetical protein EA361_13445 [Bacteroidetes bacterium]|nr:MAG: hypothetical protein EA361_13445 [Bacteroidota bacterium]
MVTLAVILAVYLVLRDFQKKALQTATDPFLLIPADAELIFHIKKPALFRESFALTGPLGQDIDAIFSGKNPTGLIHRIDSLAAAYPALSDYRNTASAFLSIHPEGNTPLQNFLLHVSFPSRVDQESLHSFIREKLFSGMSFSSHGENRQTIWSSEKSEDQPLIHYTFSNNVLSVSSSAILLPKTADLQETGQSLASDSRFNTLRNSAGRFSDNLFIRTHTLCHLIQNQHPGKSPLNLPCEDLAGWQLWDVSYNAGELLFTGYAQPGMHGQKFIDLLSEQQKKESNIAQHIPLHTQTIAYLGVSDTRTFSSGYEQWLTINELQEGFQRQRTRFKDLSGIDPDSLPLIWNGELAWIVPESTEANQGVVLLGIHNKDLLLQNPELKVFITDISPEESSEMLFAEEVYRVTLPGMFPVLSAGVVKDDFPYFAFSGNYLVASHSLEKLKAYISALRFGFNFTKSEEAELMDEFMQSGQNIFIYQSLAKSNMGNRIATSAGSKENSRESDKASKSSRSFSLQILSSQGHLAFSNAMLLHRSEYSVSNPIRWETELDAPIHKGPYRVINHNTGHVEFILQDQAGQLYLISKDGDILWKKEISGPVISDIHQVDIYKNNRYQYLFNTRNFLHLIDRNGDYVRGYPMRLPAPASAGIAVFDYDNNKNYRIIYPAENRRIYNYSLRREPVPGWQYRQSDHLIRQPLQHLHLEGKDFLLATDTTGRVQILDRRGISRLRPQQNISLLPGTRIYAHEPLDGKPHFIVPGLNGSVKQVFTDGSVFDISPDTLSHDYRFTYQSFTGTTEKDLIFLHNGNLKVYSIASRLIFSLPIERGMEGEINIIETTDNKKFAAITDKAGKRLFIVNPGGTIPPPFPLSGDTRFYLEEGDPGSFFLVTGLGNQVRSYNIIMTNER